ncbi:MAG: LytTR family DNA-binding domain-containing protein [Crocinitomicaceae bacterium]|nr:LytTR family DNA-binding domain-containing protein [Crocinitomicaceae bacterium]
MNRAIIVEDELSIRERLISLIDTINEDITIVGECDSIKDATVLISACKPDIIFLDISLSDGNSLDFLEQVRPCNFTVMVIAANDEYTLKTLKQKAMNYILKPIHMDELRRAIQKSLGIISYSHTTKSSISVRSWQENFQKIILSLNDGYQVISLPELMYCSSNKGYTTFFLKNGTTFICSKPLKSFENKFPPMNFFRVHKSYFVNMNYVDKYDRKGYILLQGGIEIPVSIRKREEFLSFLLCEEN